MSVSVSRTLRPQTLQLKLRIPDDARLTGVMMLFSYSRKEKRSNSVCRRKKEKPPGSYVFVPLHIPPSTLTLSPAFRIL